MTEFYRVRNWAKYQHYKNRNPPWIKLHVEILASEDWVMMDDASKLLAIVCMIVAAKYDGSVPANPNYIKRVAYISKQPDFKPLIECGFLEVQADARNMLADASTMLASARPEKEKEAEKEREIISITTASRRSEIDKGFDGFWLLCPRKIGKGAAKKAYAKAVQTTSPDVLKEAMRRYAASRVGEPEQYTKHPATWLNAECWLDEAKGAPNGASGNKYAMTPEELAMERENLKRLGVI